MSPSYDTAPFLLHQICTSMCVQVGAFFLAIHSLVSIFIYGYVPAKLIFGTKNKAYPKLPIPFNDSLRISLYFLHFIYSLVATFDIKTTASTCLDGYYLYCETKSKLLNIRIKLLNVTNASIYGFVNIQYCYIYAKFPIVSSSFFI
mgnify:CR=1 FL=1